MDTEDVLLIDRALQSATRIVDVVELQRAVDILGSTQNIHLARLARAKRILFVEGKDRKILERLAALAGYPDLFNNDNITAIPIGGFAEWSRVSHASWTFSQVLGEPLRCAALFDRDYRCQAETDTFVEKLQQEIAYVHVHARKEIENYLLVPTAIERALNRKLRARYELGQLAMVPSINIVELLDRVTNALKGKFLDSLRPTRFAT